MDLHSLTAAIIFGFVTDFHRQTVSRVTGPTVLRYFSSLRFDVMLYGHL